MAAAAPVLPNRRPAAAPRARIAARLAGNALQTFKGCLMDAIREKRDDHLFDDEWIVQVKPHVLPDDNRHQRFIAEDRNTFFDVEYRIQGHFMTKIRSKKTATIAEIIAYQHLPRVAAGAGAAAAADEGGGGAAARRADIDAANLSDVVEQIDEGTDASSFESVEDAVGRLSQIFQDVTLYKLYVDINDNRVVDALRAGAETIEFPISPLMRLGQVLKEVTAESSVAALMTVLDRLEGFVVRDGIPEHGVCTKVKTVAIKIYRAFKDHRECMTGMGCEDSPEIALKFASCAHRRHMCKGCLVHYIDTTTRVDVGTGMPTCHTCMTPLAMSDVQAVLDRDQMRAFYKRVKEAVGVRNGTMIRCTERRCSGVAHVADAIDSVTQCGMCSALYCVSCTDTYENHAGRGDAHCAEVRAAKRRRLLDGSRQGASHEMKPCPQCLTLIEKEPGSCNSMRCTICMLHYCFLCLKAIAFEGDGPGKFVRADASAACHAHLTENARMVYGVRSPAFWKAVDDNATAGCLGRMHSASGPGDRLVPEL